MLRSVLCLLPALGLLAACVGAPASPNLPSTKLNLYGFCEYIPAVWAGFKQATGWCARIQRRYGGKVKTSVSADEALQHLLEGNRRYSTNRVTDLHQTPIRRIEVAQAQNPFATIFGCVDSRVPPEIIFDRGLGDLLVIRTAGQVVDWAVLGSIEFGLVELGIPLIIVLGHERCGAIKATIEALEKGLDAPGQIELLVESIRPAVEKTKGQPGNLLENAVLANIELTVSRLKTSPILAEAIAKSQLKIVGARYDLDTGAVALTVS